MAAAVRRAGRWSWWLLRSWIGYAGTFAVGWFVLGGLIELVRPTPQAGDGENLTLAQAGLFLFALVGAPSLILLLLSSGLRSRESFRAATTFVLLLPLLLPLVGGGGLGMVTLLAIQLTFALWVMPSA